MGIWLAALIFDYALIALAFVAVWCLGLVAVPFSVLVIGNRQHALGVLGHEGVHGHVNDFLTNLLTFWPLGIGLSGYRAFHLGHHKWLDTDRDPEIVLKGNRYPAHATRARVVLTSLAPLVGLGLREQLQFIAYVFARSRPLDRLAPPLLWVCAALISSWWVMPLWLLSLFTVFWAANRARIWTEHVGGGTRSWNASLWQRAIYAPHNIWVHREHHKRPGVPFYDLPGYLAPLAKRGYRSA